MKKDLLSKVFLTMMVLALSWSCKKDDYNSVKGVLNCPDNNHPHMIDMGLPSGTLWACCNVGSNSPEKYGGYYAWGETTTKSKYTIENYLYKGPAIINLGNDIAGTSYDVAHTLWGEKWRMPSVAQWKELEDNCTQVYTTMNGVKGVMVKGKKGHTVPVTRCLSLCDVIQT